MLICFYKKTDLQYIRCIINKKVLCEQSLCCVCVLSHPKFLEKRPYCRKKISAPLLLFIRIFHLKLETISHILFLRLLKSTICNIDGQAQIVYLFLSMWNGNNVQISSFSCTYMITTLLLKVFNASWLILLYCECILEFKIKIHLTLTLKHLI